MQVTKRHRLEQKSLSQPVVRRTADEANAPDEPSDESDATDVTGYECW